jgi:hypothetical protein
MRVLIEILAGLAILANAVIYGTVRRARRGLTPGRDRAVCRRAAPLPSATGWPPF